MMQSPSSSPSEKACHATLGSWEGGVGVVTGVDRWSGGEGFVTMGW